VLYTVLFAVYTLFRLFDQSEWDEHDLEALSHPPAPIRQALIIRQLYASVEKYGDCLGLTLKELIDMEFIDMAVPIIMTVERAMAYVLGMERVEIGMTGLGNLADRPRSRQHIEKIINSWKILRPQLESFKRGGELDIYERKTPWKKS
jgi:hypothetical protein